MEILGVIGLTDIRVLQFWHFPFRKSPLLKQAVLKCSAPWCMWLSLKALNLQLLRCFIQTVFHIILYLGYFYWQSVAEELGFQNESRGWERADNPIESLLKAYGEKEGSTIRGLIEATRGAGLEECANDLEDILANDNSVSVDIPSVPGKENGATVYLTSDKGKINNKADSVMNVPKYTGEETNANDIADTAV